MNALIDDFAWRGLIAQSTDLGALAESADAVPLTLYCGFDPTAPSLHLGNLAQILTIRRFQLAGHQGGGLLLMATQLGMPMQMATQQQQLRQGFGEDILEAELLPGQERWLRHLAGGNEHGRRPQLSRWRNCSSAATGRGGQRRICSSHSSWR